MLWPNAVNNGLLLSEAYTTPLTAMIERRNWQWIGHIMRITDELFARSALMWTRQGKRREERPKEGWGHAGERMLVNK